MEILDEVAVVVKKKTITLGQRLVNMIREKDLAPYEAAKLAKMTRQQLFRIIQGDRAKGGVENPGIFTVQRAVVGMGYEMVDLWKEGDLVPGGPDEEVEE